MNIYVGNLTAGFTQEGLKALFAEFGEVESANIILDRYTGQSKGYGFVEMPSNSEADKAIKALNRKFVEGNTLKVNPADPGGKKKKKGKGKRRGRP